MFRDEYPKLFASSDPVDDPSKEEIEDDEESHDEDEEVEEEDDEQGETEDLDDEPVKESSGRYIGGYRVYPSGYFREDFRSDC